MESNKKLHGLLWDDVESPTLDIFEVSQEMALSHLPWCQTHFKQRANHMTCKGSTQAKLFYTDVILCLHLIWISLCYI